VRTLLAALAALVVPGAGHLVVGRRRAALVFALPVLGLLVGAVILASRGLSGVVAFLVAPGVLPLLFAVNLVLAAWRLAAAADTLRGRSPSRRVMAGVAVGALLLVAVPQAFAGRLIVATNDFLDGMFASADATPSPTDAPVATRAPDPFSAWWAEDGPPSWFAPTAAPTPEPTPEPATTGGGGCSSGAASYPSPTTSVPWERPGAVPWGSDGRFTLLLMGSDAGECRWSRRFDVMLLVEVDVASGKVAMVGLPRNMMNAPLPPGPAHDAVSCGCLSGLLNEAYVEAVERHPSLWPGSGAIKGLGAVRSIVSEITGKPIDAILAADLMGVVRVVDAMGGVDIDVPAAVHDDRYPDPVLGTIVLDIRAGEQHMDGRTALAYARSRHQDSDYGRMGRQQTLLLAIRDQMGPMTVLGAPDLFAAAKGAAWTDIPREALPALVDLFSKAQSSSVKQLRLVPPTYPSWLTVAGLDKIRTDVAALLGGVPTPTPGPEPSASPTPTASPSAQATPEPSPSSTVLTTPSAGPSPGGSPGSTTVPSPG
jgi:LCP family protein required for cell wall assembly